MLPQRREIASVVVCEDDAPTLELLCENLTADRFGVLPAPSASDALRLCRFKQPDLMLLDLTLPDASGLDVLQEIRDADGVVSRFDPRLPVIVLSGRGGDEERVRGLEFGADDYVVKPYLYGELRARMTAVLRRGRQPLGGPLRVGEIVVDPGRRRAFVDGHEVPLAEGVLAAARAGDRPAPGLLQARAARSSLGSARADQDPHARLAREPAAPQARPRAGAFRHQLLGSRLPAPRWMIELAPTFAGWPLAATMAAVAAAQGLRAGRRRSSLNEALHELRRPLQAIALAGAAGASPPALESSVRLAAAALERLDREVNGGRRCGCRPSRSSCGRCSTRRRAAGARAPASAAARCGCAGGPARRSSAATGSSSRRRSTT